MLHLSSVSSVAAATLGGPKVLLEGSNLALCEVVAEGILGVVFGDSGRVVVVLIVVLGVLGCRLAANDLVVLIWSVVVVKGMMVVITVLLVNVVGWDMKVVMSGRSCCVSTAVAEDLLGGAVFFCSDGYLLESLALLWGSPTLDVPTGSTRSDIHSDSETTKHLRWEDDCREQWRWWMWSDDYADDVTKCIKCNKYVNLISISNCRYFIL